MAVPRRVDWTDHLPAEEHFRGDIPPNVHDTSQGSEELLLDGLFLQALRCKGHNGVSFGEDVANQEVGLVSEAIHFEEQGWQRTRSDLFSDEPTAFF